MAYPFLPLRIGTDPETRTASTDATLEILSTSDRAFVACLNVPQGLLKLMQEFIFAHKSAVDNWNNVPNWSTWKTFASHEDEVRIFIPELESTTKQRRIGIVNDNTELQVQLKRLNPEDSDANRTNPFFQTPKFKAMFRKGGGYEVSFKVSDVGCLLLKFEIELTQELIYECNTTPTTFPILAHAFRESTEKTVPEAVAWHRDRQPSTRGALLNFIRCTSDSCTSTEVLMPVPGVAYPTPDAQSVVCKPFPRNRTIVFNGAWYHRAPQNGGAREFMQLDLHDIDSNIDAMNLLVEWLKTQKDDSHIDIDLRSSGTVDRKRKKE